MTVSDVQSAASNNLVQTYIRLGLATPHSSWTREEGFDLCVGTLDHPICNFAANLDLDPWSARKLVGIAQARPCFNVYAVTGDRPEYVDELLVNAGFCVGYRLVQLVAHPSPSEGSETMRECARGERLSVASFMVDQFFAQRSKEFRMAIASATDSAAGVELYHSGERSRHVAAVMLSQTPGMLGGYNLCVAPASRGRGIGSSLVRWVVAEAGRRGLRATIQCEPHLESWYQSLGFERTGWLNVYQLPKGQPSDIIEVT